MKLYKEAIPLETEYIKMCIKAIEDADYLYKDYMLEGKFPTNNGSTGIRWNYINKLIIKDLPKERFQVEVMERGIWGFLGIFDRKTKYLYTLMRENNLKTLRKNSRTKLFHYTNALSRLNDKLKNTYELENEQLCMFPDMMYSESDKEILENILNELIAKIDDQVKAYVLISFDISHGHVTDIKGIIPSVGMNYYKEESWTDLISTSYVDDTLVNEEVSDEEQPLDIIKLERRTKDTKINRFI